MSETETKFAATGRRKTAVARVEMVPGTGRFTVNGRYYDEYFPTVALQNQVLAPLQAANAMQKFDIKARAQGGGVVSQMGAVRLGISRALLLVNPDVRGELKSRGFLRRDPRMKERKKAGQPGARKRFQFSKR